MAGGKDLTYRIDVNASDATASLRSFESAVKRTMKSVSDELDDTSTAGDKVAKSMDKLASQMKEDFNSATIAAERMQQALKDAGSGLDVSDVIPTLQRMGLSFDEITQDADKLAVSLKGLDDVRMTGVADLEATAPGLSRKLDDVGKSADSSKSALANMIGNSAQDLGDMAGIAGSAGVAIGQIAEYASDAALAGEGMASVFKNMAIAGGPIAALGILTYTIGQIQSDLKKVEETKAFNAERVQRFVEALSDASLTAQELAKVLQDDGKPGIFVRIADETTNVESAVANTMGTFQKFQETVDKGKKGFDAYADSLVTAGEKAHLNHAQMSLLNTALDDARDGTLDNKVAMNALGGEWADGIKTAAALGLSVSGVDVANEQAAASSKFWGQAVAESGGDASRAAQRTQDLTNQLNQYIAESGRVPTSIVSKIYADINQGSLNEAERQLAILSRNRTMELSIIAKGGTAFTSGPRDRGGHVGAGGAIAAERRPEFIQLPSGETGLLTEMAWVPPGTNVTSGTETARILAGGSGSRTTVHVHMPRGSRPDDTVAAIRKYSRRNGGRRARP